MTSILSSFLNPEPLIHVFTDEEINSLFENVTVEEILLSPQSGRYRILLLLNKIPRRDLNWRSKGYKNTLLDLQIGEVIEFTQVGNLFNNRGRFEITTIKENTYCVLFQSNSTQIKLVCTPKLYISLQGSKKIIDF